ncbi:unnamed protein product [Amoebophrya sp. A25]|nr:unnamed protein product [Amoebophrya sp. A25]|eukprot:GSA25T00026455001.1
MSVEAGAAPSGGNPFQLSAPPRLSASLFSGGSTTPRASSANMMTGGAPAEPMTMTSMGGSSPRFSSTTAGAQPQAGQLTPLYDRQYITLHNLLEREMRQRVESERMIRDDMTSLQEGMARIAGQIHEVATDLRGNLPRLYQECKELRQESRALTQAYNQNVQELHRQNELINRNRNDADLRFDRNEVKAEEQTRDDRSEKNEIWSKLCTKAVVQDLADKVGCLDMETHAKFLERKQEYEDAVSRVKDVEEKLAKSLEEFLRGVNKCDYLYSQCNIANTEYQRAAGEVTENHRQMIEDVVYPRIERCEALLNQEMCERVECLKKIAVELVHSKEQNDRVKDQVERLAVDLSTTQAVRAAQPSPADEAARSNAAASPLDRSSGSIYGNSPAPVFRASSAAPGGPTMLTTPRLGGGSTMMRGSQMGSGMPSLGSVVIGGKVYPPGTRVVSNA